MVKPVKESRYSRLKIYIVVSALIHALVLWFIGPEFFSPSNDSQEEETIQVILVEPAEHEQQIIDFDKQSKEKPQDSHFLGMHDYKAEKETVARAKAWDVRNLDPEEIKRMLTKPALEEMHPQTALAKFFPKDVFNEKAVVPQPERVRRSLASEEMLDHIDKVEVGNETVLNTSEFKFYSYFSRIKHQVHRNWIDRVKGAALKSWMVGRPLASAMTHETQLIIVLDEEGRITNILVKKSSGVEALDKASVESFVESGPFPNPPRDLLKDQKNLQITWSFFVNVT